MKNSLYKKKDHLDVLDVSVIIAVYNTENYIREAVYSVFSQTFQDFEILVVNDGSTDATLSILKAVLAKARTLGIAMRFISQSNQGQSAAQNRALHVAQGKYIAILDSDDRWHPEYLAQQVNAIETFGGELDLSCCGCRLIDRSGTSLERYKRFEGRRMSLQELFVRGGLGTASMILVRRSAAERVGGFDESLRTSTDLDFCLMIAALRPNNIGCIPETLVDYRIHDRQTTGQWLRLRHEWEVVQRKVRQTSPGITEAHVRAARAEKLYQCAALAQRCEDFSASLKLLLQAWMQSPRSLFSASAVRHTVQYMLCACLPRCVVSALVRNINNLKRAWHSCCSVRRAFQLENTNEH